MKPTNQKAYNRSLLKFFLMWAITTALIVTAIVITYKTPSKENARLKREVERLRKDSIQQYLMESTLNGIYATIESLEESKEEGFYNEDTLKKLELYPLEGLEESKVKTGLENVREEILGLIESANESKEQYQLDLQIYKNQLILKDGTIEEKNGTIQNLETQLRQASN